MKFKEITALAVPGHAEKVFCHYKGHFNHQDIFIFFSAHPQFQRDSAPVVPLLVKHLPDLQISSGSFAIRAVSIRATKIHPTGCFPHRNELLHRGSTNVSTKKMISFLRERTDGSPSLWRVGFSTQAASPVERRRGNHLLITAPLAESTFWEQKALDGVFLRQSQT